MSGKNLNVFFSAVDRDGSRVKIANAWVYWRDGNQDSVLRANAQGIVLQLTSGPPTDPNSYQTQFVTTEGTSVRVAYNTEPTQLDDPAIQARLDQFEVKQSLSAALAQLGPILAPNGGKQTVTVLPLAEIQLQQYHRYKRAVAATMFGGLPGDIQARNMDKFLNNNYRTPTGGPKEFKGDHNGHALDELRRTIAASGANPIDIVHDIATAAQAVQNDDANDRAVALVLHGNTDRIGRHNPGVWILESDLMQLESSVLIDWRMKTSALETAKQRLADAQRGGDPDKIDRARVEEQAREDDLRIFKEQNRDGTTMLEAYDQAAKALEQARVDVVELQACGAGGSASQLAPLGLAGRLQRLLSTRTHPVQVKGHQKLIVSLDDGKKVTVWLGADTDRNAPGSQTSDTTLPEP